jgi:hypothetical protein
MLRARFLAIPAAAAAVLLLAPAGRAHEREFTLSRDWFLPYQGEHEIESRTFWDTSHGNAVQEFEYEYGITDWFAIEPGVEFIHDDEKDFEMEGVELELRFHFWSFDYDRILPAFNIEYEHALESDESDHGELKFIASRYGHDGQDISVNLNVGREMESGGEGESEATVGYVRPLHALGPEDEAGFHRKPRIGVEAVDDFEEDHFGAGPLFVYRGTQHLNVLGAYIFGLNDRDENGDELRLIVEWEF